MATAIIRSNHESQSSPISYREGKKQKNGSKRNTGPEKKSTWSVQIGILNLLKVEMSVSAQGTS